MQSEEYSSAEPRRGDLHQWQLEIERRVSVNATNIESLQQWREELRARHARTPQLFIALGGFVATVLGIIVNLIMAGRLP